MSKRPGDFEIGRDGPSVLVVGLDESATARDALAYAVGMGRRGGSDLIIVQVGNSVSTAAAAAGIAGIPLGPDQVHAIEPWDPTLAATLDELIPGQWRRLTGNGDAATELERVAAEYHADAIIVGRSRNPGRHLLGSVAARLVRHANRPVIVVP